MKIYVNNSSVIFRSKLPNKVLANTFLYLNYTVSDNGDTPTFQPAERAVVFVPKDDVSKPMTIKNLTENYTFSDIPSGYTKIKIACANSSYYFALAVRGSNGLTIYNPGWLSGEQIIDFSDYADSAKYIGITIKKSVESDFTDETIDSLGIVVTFIA